MDEEGGKKGRGRRREGERMEGLRGEDGGGEGRRMEGRWWVNGGKMVEEWREDGR